MVDVASGTDARPVESVEELADTAKEKVDKFLPADEEKAEETWNRMGRKRAWSLQRQCGRCIQVRCECLHGRWRWVVLVLAVLWVVKRPFSGMWLRRLRCAYKRRARRSPMEFQPLFTYS